MEWTDDNFRTIGDLINTLTSLTHDQMVALFGKLIAFLLNNPNMDMKDFKLLLEGTLKG